ncbi:hypothetical protein Tco_1076469, partial [Tanacetum coccineum]
SSPDNPSVFVARNRNPLNFITVRSFSCCDSQFWASLPLVDRWGFIVEDVEIVVEVVVVRIVVESIDLVSYSTSYIGYPTGDIVRTRLSVEMKVLRDLKTMMSLGFEASRSTN